MYRVPTTTSTIPPRWEIAAIWYAVRFFGSLIASWIIRGFIALTQKNYAVLGFTNDWPLFAEYAAILAIASLPLTLAEWWLLRRWMRSLPWWIVVSLVGRVVVNIANLFFGVQMQSVTTGSFSLPSVIMLSAMPTVLVQTLFAVVQALVLWKVTKRPQNWIWAGLLGAIVVQAGLIMMLPRMANAGDLKFVLDIILRLIQALPALLMGVVLVKIVHEYIHKSNHES